MLGKGKTAQIQIIQIVIYAIGTYFSDLNENALRKNSAYRKLSLAIEKRNFRERNRVKAINSAFEELRLATPSISKRSKRTSKVNILIKAIQYIRDLEFLLYKMSNANLF